MDPDLPRFINQDSYLGEVGMPPSLHRYLYAFGNPTVYVDPDGHMVWLAPLAAYALYTGVNTTTDTAADVAIEESINLATGQESTTTVESTAQSFGENYVGNFFTGGAYGKVKNAKRVAKVAEEINQYRKKQKNVNKSNDVKITKESRDGSTTATVDDFDDSVGAMRVKGSKVENDIEIRERLNKKFDLTGNINKDINERGNIKTDYPAPSRSSTPKRPEGYKKNDRDAHGNLSKQTNRAPGNRNNREDDNIQSHHSVQDKWAEKNNDKLFDGNYRRDDAPGILLQTKNGPHRDINKAQIKRRKELRQQGKDPWGTSIKVEFNTGYKQMINAGVSKKAARKAIKQSYKYFDSIGGFK